MHDTGFAHPLIRSIIDVRHTDQEGTLNTTIPPIQKAPDRTVRFPESSFSFITIGVEHVLMNTPERGSYPVHKGWFSVYRTIKKRYGLTEQEVRSLVSYNGKRGKQ